jgi:16S rRNA processing protein RimM
MAGPALVLVGVFGAAQGVRGEVRIKSFTADPLSIASYGPLTDARGARVFRIAKARLLRDDMLVVSLEGVGDRDAAQALTGTDLFVAREKLPPPDEDEVYVADLVGLTAVDDTGARVGTIVAVPNFGAGDILEIRPEAGGDTILVPFTKTFVPLLDLATGRVTVVLPAVVDDGAGDA